MDWLASNHEAFLFSEELHDVVFEFVDKDSEDEILPAHALILAFASEVFRTQFYGVLQQRTIKIEDANIESFKVFLRFIYTGKLSLSIDNMFQLAYLAKKYLIADLTSRVAAYFKEVVSDHDNFWDLFNPESIQLFDDDSHSLLTELLVRFNENPAEVLRSEQFFDNNENIISQLVRCEALEVKEFDLYEAIVWWAALQCEITEVASTTDNMRRFVKGFIHSLRLPTLKNSEMIGCKGINTNNLLTEEEKSSLLCYVGGQLSARVPFEKMPRFKSRDLYVVTSTRNADIDPLEGSIVSASFFITTTCRFVGVTCVINTKCSATPSNIVFELRCSRPEEKLYSFNWVSDSEEEVQDLEITCMTGDLIPMYADSGYTITAHPSEGVSMNTYKGDFIPQMEWPLSNHEAFLFSEDLHDVVFEFVNKESEIEMVETLPAHALILAFASEVFRTQLYGVLQERTIKIEDANIETFKVFLRFVYTGKLNLSVENMFELAYLAKKYLIPDLTTRVAAYFKGKIHEHENFWDLFNPESIELFDDDKNSLLIELLARFEEDPEMFLDSEEFLAASANVVGQLIRCERLAVKEFDLYEAVVQWAQKQCELKEMCPTVGNMRRFVKGFIHSLRLPTLKITDLIARNGINTNNLLTKKEKSSLLCYVGGQLSAPVPFMKMPRLYSSDLLCGKSRRSDIGPAEDRSIPSLILALSSCRFVGVSCVINTKRFTTPTTVKIVFELRSDEPERTEYSFEWLSECLEELQDFEVSCMAHDLIPMYADSQYMITAKPSDGVAMHYFKGAFTTCSGERAVAMPKKWRRSHVFKSLNVLEM